MIRRARCGEARLNDARLWHPWLRINRVVCVMVPSRWSAEARSQVRVEFSKALALRSEIRRAGWSTDLGVSGLALICAERTRETRRFQSSSAPRVLLNPRSEQRELEQRRTVVQNYAERLRAGSSPTLVC
jgi:hypothetical protein